MLYRQPRSIEQHYPFGQGKVRQQRRHVKTKETGAQSLFQRLVHGNEFNHLGRKYQSPLTRIQVSLWVLVEVTGVVTAPGIETV